MNEMQVWQREAEDLTERLQDDRVTLTLLDWQKRTRELEIMASAGGYTDLGKNNDERKAALDTLLREDTQYVEMVVRDAELRGDLEYVENRLKHVRLAMRYLLQGGVEE